MCDAVACGFQTSDRLLGDLIAVDVNALGVAGACPVNDDGVGGAVHVFVLVRLAGASTGVLARRVSGPPPSFFLGVKWMRTRRGLGFEGRHL